MISLKLQLGSNFRLIVGGPRKTRELCAVLSARHRSPFRAAASVKPSA
jgi:hypothetical protein